MEKRDMQPVGLTEADLTQDEMETYLMGLDTLAGIEETRRKSREAAESDYVEQEEKDNAGFDKNPLISEGKRSVTNEKRLVNKLFKGRKETILYMNMMSPEDRDFMRHFYKLGCMSFTQLWRYRFTRKSENYARRILKEWVDYGVLEFIVIQDINAPLIQGRWRRYAGIKTYFLSSEALATVGAWMGLEENEIYRKRDNGTRLAHHTLGVNDLVLGLHFDGIRAEDGGSILDDWISQREAIISWSSIGNDRQLVKPDGRIDRYAGNAYLFFEYETGEVPPSKVVAKLNNYIQMISQNTEKFSKGGRFGKIYILTAFSSSAGTRLARVKTMLKSEIESMAEVGPGTYQYIIYFGRIRAFEVVFRIGHPREIILFTKEILK